MGGGVDLLGNADGGTRRGLVRAGGPVFSVALNEVLGELYRIPGEGQQLGELQQSGERTRAVLETRSE